MHECSSVALGDGEKSERQENKLYLSIGALRASGLR